MDTSLSPFLLAPLPWKSCHLGMTRKFTVAICGGGVGGLTCAVALSRYADIQVDVYESASKFAEIGAGIGMWPRTWKIMQALDLDRELAQVAIDSPPHQRPRT